MEPERYDPIQHLFTPIRFVTASDLIICHKQVKIQRLLLTCVPISELPSIISTIGFTSQYIHLPISKHFCDDKLGLRTLLCHLMYMGYIHTLWEHRYSCLFSKLLLFYEECQRKEFLIFF